MNRWRRMAVTVVRHAARVLPGAGSPWAAAMRHELDYIADDRAALRWALGCVAASYAARLATFPQLAWRMVSAPVAAASVVLVVGLALQGHASDDPALEQPACARADESPDAPRALARSPIATSPAAPAPVSRTDDDNCGHVPRAIGRSGPPRLP